MSINKIFLKNSFLYSISTLFIRAGQFFLLPFLWLKLSPSDFGTLGLCQIVLSILVALFDIGSCATIQRLYYEWFNDKGKYLFSIVLFSILFSILTSLLLLNFNRFFTEYILSSVSFFPFIQLIIIQSIFQNITNQFIALTRIKQNLKSYTTFSILFFIVQITATLYAVFVLDKGILGYIYALTLNAVCFGSISFILLLKEFKIPKDFTNLKESLRYGLPLLPTAIIENLSNSIERLFLEKVTPLATVGLFTLGNQLGSILNIINQIIKSSYFPLVYKIVSSKDSDKNDLAKLSFSYLGIMSFFGIGLMILLDDLIRVLNNEKYLAVIDYYPAFIIGFWLISLSSAYGRGIDYSKKTYLNLIPSIVSITSSITLSLYLIPKYEEVGAAIVFVVTCFIRMSLNIFLANLVYKRPVYWKKSFIQIVIFFSFFIFDFYYLSSRANIILDLLTLTLYSLLSLILFPEVKKMLRMLIKKIS